MSDSVKETTMLSKQLQAEMSDIFFVLDNAVLGDDVHAIILSLLEEFVSLPDLKNNLELSQFYSINCDTTSPSTTISQIVLRYNVTSIGSNAMVSCIKFFVKRMQTSDTYKYTRLRAIHVSFDKMFVDATKSKMYVRGANLDTMEKTVDMVMGDIQTNTIKTNTLAGTLQIFPSHKIPHALDTVNKIITQTKDLAVQTLDKMVNPRECTSSIPSNIALDLAIRFADKLKECQDKNLSTILIPDRNIEILNGVIYQPDATVCVTVPTSLTAFSIYRTSRGEHNSLYPLATHIDTRTNISDNAHIVIVSHNLSVLIYTDELSDLESISKVRILKHGDVKTLSESMSISNKSVTIRIQNKICKMLGQEILEFKPS